MSDNLASDAPSQRNGNSLQRHMQAQRGSSARPRGPPSESNAPTSDDEGFADDQVVGAGSNRPRRADRAIPRVLDEVGMIVGDRFEQFLDSYATSRPAVAIHQITKTQ